MINNETLKVYHSPNPFYTSTVISYNLPEEKNISLEVYNIKGQRIKTLYNGNATIGEYQVTWNGTDENNRKVSSGIYFYKLITSEKVILKKDVVNAINPHTFLLPFCGRGNLWKP